MKPKVFLALAIAAVVALVAATMLWPQKDGVTIYCAVDDVHSIPILDAFERETGIHVHRNFDTEANKTVGLVQRLREERGNPRADVFWNNEIMHTIRLAREGVLESYDSPNAADIPATFRDKDRMWTGFGARARILIVNTELVGPDEMPTSMNDLLDPKWKGRASFVRPLTGTTLTHASVLYTVLGADASRELFRGMHANECLFPSGNASLARAVAGGQSAFGFTDTDDYEKVLADGRPVARIYPDQQEGGVGTLLIPNTVALVKGGPRPDLGKQLVDFLCSKRVEEMLAHGDSAQIPVRGDVKRPNNVVGPPEYRVMEVDWNDVVEHFDERLRELEALWRLVAPPAPAAARASTVCADSVSTRSLALAVLGSASALSGFARSPLGSRLDLGGGAASCHVRALRGRDSAPERLRCAERTRAERDTSRRTGSPGSRAAAVHELGASRPAIRSCSGTQRERGR